MPLAKVAIIGAGSVGTAVAVASAMRGVARTIALYDSDGSRAHAEALDLRHGAPFVPALEVVGGDDPELLAGSDVVVLTAGARQRAGESRLELASANVAVCRAVMDVVARHAPAALVLVVSNPVDVITYVAQQSYLNDPTRVFGSGTVLDTARLRVLLAARCGVSVANVHATIAGEHGDSEFPLWSSATVGGAPLRSWFTDNPDQILDAIARDVREAAYRIIEGKGSTSTAIGLASARILAAIANDERAVLAVSTRHIIDGVGAVCLSLPTIVGRRGVGPLTPTPLDDAERTALVASARAIRAALEAAGAG